MLLSTTILFAIHRIIKNRFFFREYQSPQNIWKWFLADYISDALYLADIIIFKHRIIFMEKGFWVKDKRKLIRNYIQGGSFR